MSQETQNLILSDREARRRAEVDAWIDDQATAIPAGKAPQYGAPTGPPSPPKPTTGQTVAQGIAQAGKPYIAGAKAAGEAIVHGVGEISDGFLQAMTPIGIGGRQPAETPLGEWTNRMKGIKRVVDGLFSVGLAPAAAVTAGATANMTPEQLDATWVNPITSGFIRTMMGGATGDPQVDNAPMSAREALGIIGAVLFAGGAHMAAGRGGGGGGKAPAGKAAPGGAEAGPRALPGATVEQKALPPGQYAAPGGVGPIPGRGPIQGEIVEPRALGPAPFRDASGAIPLGPSERYTILENLRAEGKLEPLMRAVAEDQARQAETAAAVGEQRAGERGAPGRTAGAETPMAESQATATQTAAPFFETTPAGEKQAMIPGTEGRQIPEGKIRAQGPQAEGAGPLFEKPGPAQMGIEDADAFVRQLKPADEVALTTPDGEPIARLKMLRNEGRGAGTYEVLEWQGGDTPLPFQPPNVEGAPQTFRQYFEGRSSSKLVYSKEPGTVSREGAPLGYLQLASADAKYLRPVEAAPKPTEPLRTQRAQLQETYPEELRPLAEAASEGIADALAKTPPQGPEYDAFLKIFEDVPELAPATERGGVVASERVTVADMLGRMANELEGAEAGKRVRNVDRIAGKGKRETWIAQPSTYPPYMGELGVPRTRAGANRLMNALAEVIEGRVETPMAQKIQAYAERLAAEQNYHTEGRAFVDRLRAEGLMGEEGHISATLLARMGIGALLGTASGDTPEERVRNAFIGAGLGLALSTRLANVMIDRMAKQGSTTLGMGMGPMGEFSFMPNFRWIASTEKVKGFLKEMHEEPTFIKDLERQARGIRSHEVTEAAARRLIKEGKVTANRILGFDEGTILNAEEATAARKFMIASANQALLVAERIGTGKAKPTDNIRHAIVVAGSIARNVDAVMTETGRALNAFKIMAESDMPVRVSPARIAELAATMAPSVPEARLAEMVRDLKTPEQVGRFGKWLQWLPSDALMEVYYGAVLLSNPMTQVRNIVGSTYAVLTAIAERQAGGLRPGGQVALGEAGSMAVAGLESLRDAFRYAREPGADISTKLDVPMNMREPAFTAEKLGVDPSTPWGAGLDYLGKYARMNLKLLEGEDRGFKFLNFSMERKALALRTAEAEGLQGAARDQRIAELWNDPPRDLLEQAWHFAEDQTFSRAFEGRMARFAESTSHPLVKMLILPFLRTPIRLAEYAAERTPVLNLLTRQFRADMAEGGAKRDLAMAKVGVGALISASVGYGALQGLITGNPPKDAEERKRAEEAGVKWTSIYNPTTQQYYSYANLEPLSSIVAVVTDTTNLLMRAPEAEDIPTELGQIVTAVTLSSIRNLASKQYLQAVGDFLDAVQSPQTNQALTFAQKRLAGWVPAIVGQAERIYDPVVREADTLLEEFQKKIPGMSEWLVPRLNVITGEPLTSGGGLGLASARTSDPVLLEIQRLEGAGIRAPAPWLSGTAPSLTPIPMDPQSPGQGIPLNKREYNQLIELLTSEKGPGGRTLHQAMADLIARDDYARQSDGQDGGKAVALRSLFHGYVEQARGKLRQARPDLEDKIKRRMGERAIQRAPTDQQEGMRRSLEGLLGTIGR